MLALFAEFPNSALFVVNEQTFSHQICLAPNTLRSTI
jgi:hypothetical protein